MMDKETDLAAWLREEALNLKKILSGERRLDFVQWKHRRDERARTVRGGDA